MRTILVIAGTLTEFRNYILDVHRHSTDFEMKGSSAISDGTRYIYASRPEILLGLKIDEYVKCGSFFERKDIEEIEKELIARRIGDL